MALQPPSLPTLDPMILDTARVPGFRRSIQRSTRRSTLRSTRRFVSAAMMRRSRADCNKTSGGLER